MEKVFCATVLYRFSHDEAFDVQRYASSIAPRYAEVLGKNCVRFEVRQGVQPGGEHELAFICIASFWVKSPQDFMASMHDSRMKELLGEIARFSTIQPVRQFDEVVSSQPGWT